MHRTYASKAALAASTEKESRPRRVKWILSVVGVLVVAAGASAAAWHYTQPGVDPEVQKTIELRDKAFRPPTEQAGPQAAAKESATSEEVRRKAREEFRAQMDKLDDSQREEVMRGMREMFRASMQERMAAYHAMSPQEKQEHLNAEIDRMESWRNREGGGPPFAPPSGPPPARENDNRGDATGTNGGGNADNNRGNGDRERRGDRDGFRHASPERREEFRRRMLDDTTPEERAQFAAYFEDLNAARQKRGLDPIGPGTGRRR